MSVILRCSIAGDQFHHARSCYALTLSMFIMRFIQTFYVHPKIGPKVIMIMKMVSLHQEPMGQYIGRIIPVSLEMANFRIADDRLVATNA
jgi:hypothetical protein